MKLTLFGIAFSLLTAAGMTFAQTVNFDSPNDLSNNFVINGTTGNFTQVASGGITGGAVDVLTNNASDTAIYKTAVSSGVGQTVSTSIFFRYSRALRDYNNYRFPVEVGFATSTTVSTFPSSPYQGLDAGALLFELNDGSGQMLIVCRAGGDTRNASLSFSDLLEGHWYRFTLDLTVTGDSFGALQFKAFLQDYGTNGQTPAATRITGSATVNSTKVTQASQLYAGFYAQKDGGTDLLDNFSVMNGATPPMGADLGLTLAADRNPVPVGRNVTYTATIINNGPSDSGNVNLSATLPSGEFFQNISCDGSCASSVINNSISVALGTIPASVARHVFITAQVQSQGSLTVNGSVSSGSTQDENPQNNSASFTTTGAPAPPVPTFSTAVQPSSITLGASTKDVATLSNGTNPTGTITFKAYSPNDTSCGGTPVFTSTVTVNGNGSYNSAVFTPSATGTYRFIATYGGDDNNGAVAGTCGAANESVTVSPAPTPTPTPRPTPTPTPVPTATPTPSPSLLGNISTRLKVESGDNVLIGGFIITGTEAKRVMIRGIGPSLTSAGVSGALQNPTLELYQQGASVPIAANDNWVDAPNKQEIIDSTIAPKNDFESAILTTLPANNSGYTAVVRGLNGGRGIGLVEVYDLGQAAASRLAQISTRGFVQTGNDVMIGGFFVLNGTQRVIVRAIGPSLTGVGVSGALQDTTLDLVDGNGTVLATNDNWRTGGQEAEIIATTVPPSNDLESAIVRSLAPGPYTAIVRGVNNTIGIALVEVYALN